MSKIKIEIKNRWTGNGLFEYEKENNTIKDTLEKAIEENANLSSADLRGANLSSADLRGTYIFLSDNDINVEEVIKDFEEKAGIKVTEHYINHDVIPTRWNCFWRNGLIIRQYEVVEKKQESKFKVGDKVKLNPDIIGFRWGRSNVSYEEIGTITNISEERIIVNFPNHNCWDGLEHELIKVEAKEMTVAEISKELGYEVKIVKGSDE